MTAQLQREDEICRKLMALGYAKQKQVRMYGEDFDLISDPVADKDGFAIAAVSRKSGDTRKLRIPLSVLRMISGHLARSALNAA